MTILETIDGILKYQVGEQKSREENIVAKDKEIARLEKSIVVIEARTVQIQQEIKESNFEITELKKLKEQFKESICGEQVS